MHRVLVAFLVVLAAGQAHATDVAGSIGSNTTWNLAGSPYKLTSNAIVAAGVTLTIDPGVEVRGVSGAQLVVNGTLAIAGTTNAPVVFREDATTWAGISFADGSTAQLANVEIRKATTAIKIVSPEAASYTFNGVVLKDFTVRGVDLSGTGTTAFTGLDARTTSTTATAIYDTSVHLTLTKSVIVGGSTGVNATGANLTLDHTVVADATIGVSLSIVAAGTIGLSIDHATFWSNPTAIQVYRGNYNQYLNLGITRSVFSENDVLVRDTSGGSYPTNFNTFNENVWTGTKVSGGSSPNESGNLNYVALLADPANGDFSPTERSPARYFAPADPNATVGAIAYAGKPSPAGVHGFWYVNKTFAADSVTEVAGDMVVAKDVTVTFLPGAELRMKTGDAMAGGKDAARTEIRVEGTLEADGTNSHPVKFTSAAATPKAGDWYGIVIIATTQAFNVSQVDIGYGYRGVTLEANDHIVAGSVIHHCSDAGVWISGGTPNVESTELRQNSVGIYAENATGLDIVDVDSHDNQYQGARFRNATATWSIGRVYNNGTQGIDVSRDIAGTSSLALSQLTIAHNAASGITTYRGNYNQYQTLSIGNSAITHNTGTGITDNYGGSYPTTVYCSSSDIWGNAGRDSGVSYQSDTCFAENPLYVDAAARNYAPTTHSPLRFRGSGNDLVGAVEYGGVDGPLLEGWLWESFTFTKSGSPWPILGDITVPANVTVYFEPGATLQFVTGDDMKGGVETQRSELSVLDGGKVVFDGGGAPIVLTSAAASPVPGSWYGMRLVNAATSIIDNVRVEYPKYGAFIIGPKAPSIEDARFIHHDLVGIHAESVSAAPQLDVLASWVIGDGNGTGIELTNANARIRSSYVTHHGTGISAMRSIAGTSTTTLTNNTIVHHATGVYLYRGNYNQYSNVTLENNVIAASTSGAVTDGYVGSYPTNLTARNNNYFNVTTTSYSANTNTGHITTDPKVEDDDWDAYPRWWDGKLWAESLAINAGYATATDLPTRDILGNARKIGAAVDIGAFEFDPAANKEPRADACTASLIVPRGESFTLDGSKAVDPDGFIASAYWTMSDGTVTAGQSVTHTFANAGDTQWAYITVVDDKGAEDHALVKVNVDIRPIADAGPAVFQDQGPAEEVFFDGTLSTDPDGTVVGWSWNFGDGTPVSTEKSPRHSYLSAGVYTVTLTVTDNEGLTHSDTTLATVYGTNDTVGPHVQHTEIADGVPVNTAVVVQADITDPSGVASAVVLYRPIGGTTAQFVSMTQVGTTNTWKATIPAAGVTSAGVEYWFVCADAATPNANSSTTPANAPTGGVYNFLVVGDPNPPTIVHTEISDGQTTGQAVAVSATITDATGVAKANLYFRPKGGTSFGAAPMAKISGNTWSAQIPAFVVTSPGVEYYLEATDTSPIPNTGYAPANAPAGVYDFTVGSGDVTPPIIAHTPITNGKPAGSAVAVTCSAADNIGVTGVMLYYRVTGAGAFTATALAASGGTSWSGNIPAAAVTTAGVDYYLVASDAAANHASSPDTAPTTWNSFTVVAVDTSAPTIVHTAIPNGQAAGSSPVVTATITDTSGVASAKLLYRPHGFPVFQEVAMTANGNTWTASIPSFVVTPPSVEYYIRASDTPGNIGNYPAGGAAAPIVFTVIDGSADTTAPNIVHDPIANGQTAGQAIAISALVSDGTGVASVTLRYRAIGTSSWTVLAMVAGASSSWSATIPVAAVKAPGLEYYLEAVDSSAAANKSTAPAAGANGPYSFAVNDVDATPPTIVHTTMTSIEAGSPLAISATISDDDEVASATLRWAPGAAAFASIAMVKTTGATWTATVPAASIPAGTTSLRYVITAVDPTGNSASHPTTGEANPHVVSVTDTVAPVVSVGAIADGKTAGTAVPVTATVTDVNPVSAVTLYYKTTGSAAAYASVAMTGAAGSYTASIPAATVVLPGVSYYVSASDGSNVGYGPATAPATPAAFTVVNGCSDECTAAAKRCSGNAVETCGNYDADACTEWGGSSACGATQTCTNGACVAAPPADLVINEVLYDDVGSDVNAFVELYGPPSTSLVGYSLVGVNGNGGTEFNTIALTGSTGADGFYVVAKTGSNAAILAAADQTSANADYQNGPDNIQLRQGTTVVDAVGYGTFAVGDVFAGEGSAVPGVTSGVSVGRDASATDTDANVDDFYPQLAWTPGAPNQAKLSAAPVAHVSCPTSGSVGVALTLDGSGSTDDGSITAYDWSFGDTQSGSGASVQHTYAAAGTFVVTLTVTDDQHQTDTDTCSIAVTVADTAGPTIVHTPSAGPLAAGQPLSVSANITDASGVASAKLHWRTKGAPAYTVVNMTGSAGTYTATIASLAAPGVEYWIDATDSKGNAAALPLTAPTVFFAIDVYVPDTTAPAIVHTPVSGNHAVGVAVALEATVTDASGIASVKVFYRASTGGSFTEAALTAGANNVYSGVIPSAAIVAPGVQYYLQAVDKAAPANTATSPATAPAALHSFTVGSQPVDTTAPTITHTPVAGPLADGVAVPLTATATDASGIASLTLYFRPQGSPTWLSLPLTPTTGSSYSGSIPALAVTAPGIEYYLAAVDASANANHATLPATAPTAVFSVAVTAPDVAGPTLELDPVATPVTAGTPVPVAVTATDASGVASVDLYFHKAGTSWQTLAMTAGADDRWTAVIPGASVVEGVLELYVSADDDVGNTATEPADGAADPIEVQVDPKPVDDVVAPVILHSPVSVVAHGEAAPISAVVTDASGVATVVVLYRADGESDFTSLALVDQGGGHWSGSIPATATLGASVDYYLEATDSAPAANVARDPEDAPSGLHTIDVLGGPDEDISVEAVETVEPGPEADTSVAEETTSPGDDTGPSTADEGSAAEAEAVVTHGGSDGGCAGGDVGGALGLLAAVGVLAALALARRRGALSAP